MCQELSKIVEKERTKIVEAWQSQAMEKSNRQLNIECLNSLFDFLLDIIQGEEQNKLFKTIDEILNKYYLTNQLYRSNFFQEISYGKDMICQTISQSLDSKEISWKALFDFSDRFEKFMIGALDRFSKKNSEIISYHRELFEQATNFLKSTVNFSNIGLFILDKNMNIIYWGEGVARLYDIKEREVLNRHVLEMFPVLEKEGVYQKLSETLRTGESFELISLAHQSLKKGRRIIDYKISPLKDKKKNIIGVNVLLNDVTDRKRDEQSLKEYERFISNFFEDAAEAIFVLDENDCVKMWNKQAAKMYGYSADEMIGKHISKIVPNDEQSQKEIEHINRIVRTKGFVKDWETERITVDGRKILLRLTRTAIRDERGNYLGSSVIAHDITEQRRLEQQLIQSEKLSAVGQLAAGIAHEVGSPLTAISSLAQLLYERSDDEWNRDKLKMIREQIDRISRIVRELVNFSKPISTSIGEVSINKVIEEAMQIVRYDKRLKHFKIKLDLFPHLPFIRISFDQMLQVLINILLNAGDAMEGKTDGEIAVSTRLVGEKIIVSIIDNGVGIPKESLDRIFEPFFTTKKAGKGTGLGLWVCYNIIKGFAGDIIVESESNQGTAFHIILPVLKNLDEPDNE